ncbi:MAG: hypothetical protein RIC53_07705 [Cyclobacteriaceae bacterium]
MIKHYNIALYLLIVGFFSGCLSEKESDLFPDCSETDLILNVASVTNAACSEPGSVTLVASGGISGYTYSLDGKNFQQDVIISGLSAGTYTLHVKDKAGCTATRQVEVGADNGSVVVEVSETTLAGCGEGNGSVTLSASGGEGDYSYSIDDGEFDMNPTFSGLSSGVHTYSVKDSEGCIDDGTVTLLAGTSLESEIMPIIENNCATSSSCHANGASGRPIFESKNVVISRASNIQNRTSNKSMPPAGSPQLSQDQINLITCWAEDGALDN